MIRLISFQENGELIEHVGQIPAFYGLSIDGEVLEYFTSVEALRLAVESLKVAKVERTETVSISIAA